MRVVIAEDQVLLREGLARLFADGGHEVVATLGDARHLLATVAGPARPRRARHPHAADVHRRGRAGGQAVKDGAPRYRRARALPAHRDLPRRRPRRRPGFGYLLKDRVLEVEEFLAGADRVAAAGRRSIRGRRPWSRRRAGGPLARLSEREREVLS